MVYLSLKYLHVLGAAILFGTGVGIAFFMLMAHIRRETALIAGIARIVVKADFVFTATAVVLQPLTGIFLADAAGYSLREGWLSASLVLYSVVGLFWVPVVWMQIRMRDIAATAVANNAKLPDEYYRLFRFWFAFGIPAFAAVMGIIWLMVSRPDF